MEWKKKHERRSNETGKYHGAAYKGSGVCAAVRIPRPVIGNLGEAKMAGQLNAISFEGFMKINHMTIYYINTHAGTVFETTRTDVWIPCSERLPEEPEGAVVVMEELEEYLVAVYGADKPTTLKYAGNGEWWDDFTEGFYPVLAWQPMPDHYVGATT